MQPRDTLLGRREEAIAVLATLERDFAAVVAASGDSNADDEHDPEGATIAFERAQLHASITQTRSQIAELDAALGRVADGTYGVCSKCGQPIPAERLEARPAATTHVACVRS